MRNTTLIEKNSIFAGNTFSMSIDNLPLEKIMALLIMIEYWLLSILPFLSHLPLFFKGVSRNIVNSFKMGIFE